MSPTPSVARPEALTALDNMAKTGGDNVAPHVRAAAAVNSPESNLAIKNMTAGDGKTMNPFVGNGDCSIGDKSATASAAAEKTAEELSHTVNGELRPDSTLGNDTKYSVSAKSDSSDIAKQLANNQASNLEQAA